MSAPTPMGSYRRTFPRARHHTAGTDWDAAALAFPSAKALKNTLPTLPGYGFDELKQRPHLHKRQTFSFRDGVPQATDAPAAPPELRLREQRISAVQIANALPEFSSLDKKVLRFVAFFKEGVHERPDETERVRKVNIYYFLEDETIQVTEPKVANSGIPQGNLIRRHRIPRQWGGQDYYAIDDFNIGNDVCLYGKTFHIVDCDAFTRYFYNQMGLPLRPKEDTPPDAHGTRRELERSAVQPIKAKDEAHKEFKRFAEFAVGGRLNLPSATEREAARNFLENDRRVLRFNALWDDRRQLYGDHRLFTILYFLADDTMKVIEVNQPNSGRDPFPVFINRQRLPAQKSPHQGELNLETMATAPRKNITDQDLAVGKRVWLYGREFLLYDCDDFTRQHYADKFGIMSMEPVDISLPARERPVVAPPPHHGFGSDDDSLVSWKHLVLKPPRKPAMTISGDEKILRFGGYLDGEPDRRIIIRFYLADDTVAMFEQPARNNGVVSGKILQRQKVRRAPPQGAPAAMRRVADYLTAEDFYVGAKVSVNGHWVALDTTDEATMRLMDGAPKVFGVADVASVLGKLRGAVLHRHARVTEAFRALDLDHNGYITVEELASACATLNLNLCEHEIVTLMRYLDVNGDGVVDYNEFVARLQAPDYSGGLEAGSDTIQQLASEEDRQAYTDLSHQRQTQADCARVLQLFIDKLASRRYVFLDVYRMMSDRSPDSKVGIPEFRRAVDDVLQLHFTPQQLQVLYDKFFPEGPNQRLTLKQFSATFNTTNHFQKK